MIIFKIFLFIIIVESSYAEFMQIINPFNPGMPPQVPMCPPSQRDPIIPTILKPTPVNSTALDQPKDSLRFLLPFVDMEIQYDRNIHIMQETVKQQIYILHGHELYQLFIDRQEKRLSLMAILTGSIRHLEPLGAKIISWQGNLILVIALDERLEIYQLSEHSLLQRAEIAKDPARTHESAPVFEAIQQLTLRGKFQKLFLFSIAMERVMIVATINYTKLYGKFRTFEWFNTYFDPVEDLTVPSIHVVNVVGAQTKYLVAGHTIKHQTKTILTVYEFSQPSIRLQAKQTLTVQSRVVHIFTYRNRSMIVACSSKQRKCSSFRQLPDGNFNVYRQRTSKEFTFDMMVSSSRFVGATRQNQVMIFTNHRLDCFGSFLSDQTDVTDLIGHQNRHKEDYVLVIYKRPFKVLIRIVELEISVKDFATGNQSEPEDMLASTRHQHLFETTIGKLRSILLQRKMDMDVLRKVSNILRPKMKHLEVSKPITQHSGNVGIIKVVGTSLRSPQQVLEKISELRQTYMPQRPKRSDKQRPYNITLEITNRVKVNRMKVHNLIYQGDVMEGFSLNQTGKQSAHLNIQPKVKTHTLNTSELIKPVTNVRDSRQQNIPDIFFDVKPVVRVHHLKVGTINGVDWNAFYESLFLKNRDKVVQGRLVLQSDVNVNNLLTTVLNGLTVSNLFNLKYPQIVNSDIIISRFFVHDLKAKTVNDLVFEEDVVFNGNDTYIETPVIMHHLKISGDILLADNITAERLLHAPGKVEFKQFYTNKVIINGSLIVNNLSRENENKTKLILGQQEFDENEIKEKYLLRGLAQNFSYSIIFDDTKVVAPWLETKYLNDHITEQHMMVNRVRNIKPLLVVFMKAHVQGDVMCLDYKSKIAEIKENIIYPGDKVNVTGIKLFKAPLEVNDMTVLSLNGILAENLISKSLLNNIPMIMFKDMKTFSSIKVNNPAFIEQELKASYLNNLPLEDLLNNDYYMDRAHVTNLVETSNIVFHKINGISFDDFFKKIHIKDDRIVLHKDLIVEGNVLFEEPLQLKYINDVHWNDYVESLVRINENAVIKGDVCFSNDLTITKEFETKDISGSDLEVIFKNVLMKSKPQLITGLYNFDYMNVSNIDVRMINNVNVLEFFDLKRNVTEIEGDLIVEKLNIRGNLHGNIPAEYMNLEYFKERSKQVSLKPLKNLYVLNNVSWPQTLSDNTQHEMLKYFHKNAVKSNTDQVITGNVRISIPLIKKMQTRVKFPANVNIDFIYRDGLLKNSTEIQSIKGEKAFLKTLYMEKLEAKSQVYSKLLNKIDVLHFNQSLYRLGSGLPLQGPLKFLKPLSVDHVHIDGFINGINPSLIYQLSLNSSVPAVNLRELHVEKDLLIKNINNMNLDYFLDNRVTLQGPALEHFGVLTFKNLVIEKETLLQSINNITIDNLVFKHSPYLQTISGHKTIGKSLEIVGPAHVMHINNKDLMKLYSNTLTKEKNYQFDNLIIDQATFRSGLQVVRNLNFHFQQRTFTELEEMYTNSKKDFLRFLVDFKVNLTSSRTDILYLDYDLNTTIRWESSQRAPINKTSLYEMSRISSCEKQYLQISLQHPNNIYLRNVTSNRLAAVSNKISVKVENYCKFQNRKVKSKVIITGQKLLKVFGMKRIIKNIYIIDNDKFNNHFVILHALDLPSLNRNEVRVFKLSLKNNTVIDWQGLIQNVGEQLKLYEFQNLKALITNGLTEHHPALTIYHFNFTTQLFTLYQIIDGDYDIIEMIELPQSSDLMQLIVSCSKCQRIFIYEFNSSSAETKYEIFQIISLKTSIDKLVMFSLKNDYYMLVVSDKYSNFYAIYKYSYIQGWLHLTFGYFPNLQMSIPISELLSNDDNLVATADTDGVPLILLCNFDNCYLVKAIV